VKRNSREKPSCPKTCKALCCQYLVKKIPTPRSKYDYDELYWVLCHERSALFVQRRIWYLLVEVPCQHLDAALACRIYPLRPLVCRLHNSRNCEYGGEVGFEAFLDAPQDLVRFLQKEGINLPVPWMPGRAGRSLSQSPDARSAAAAGVKGQARRRRKRRPRAFRSRVLSPGTTAAGI